MQGKSKLRLKGVFLSFNDIQTQLSHIKPSSF
jgi:hypothetical protein